MSDETTPLIPTNERGTGRRACGVQSEAARKSLRADVIGATCVLAFAGALVLCFAVHKHPHQPVDYYAKTAYPYTNLFYGWVNFQASVHLAVAASGPRCQPAAPHSLKRWPVGASRVSPT